MKYKFTIRNHKLENTEVIKNNKKEADEFINELHRNKDIRCFWYEPLNKPEQRIRINLNMK